MSELKPILQWVTIVNNDDIPEITHQFDEEDNQVNISHVLDLAEIDKLAVLIAIPVGQRMGEEKPVGNPFIAVDMKTGVMNINGTNWNFVPNNIDPLTVKFRPIWYHSVIKDYDATSNRVMGERISLYKIGWQFTLDEKNYQRIVFFDTQTGIFSLKEKR
jgi:hypothetical protein